MKKRIIFIVLCFCLTLSLVSCGRDTEEKDLLVESIPASETEEMEIVSNTEVNEQKEEIENIDVMCQEMDIRFADADEGRSYIKGNENYLNNLNQNELCYRLQKSDATLDEYIVFAEQQVLEFTEEEKEAVSLCMQKIWDNCKENQYSLPNIGEIVFVKTTMKEECGASAYTHGTQIYLGEQLMSLLVSEDEWTKEYATTILAHELFHCLTRNDEQFREDMYGIIGFNIQENEFAFSSEIRERMITNPDVGKHNAYATFKINGEDRECVVVITTSRAYQNPGDNMHELMSVGVVPVDELSVLYPMSEVENYQEVFGYNTDYVIDPEEALADNFSYAIMYGVDGMDYESPEIIQEICDYLKSNR